MKRKLVYKVLQVLMLIICLSACTQSSDSELVTRLEAIFYDPSFALIPDREFSVETYGAVGDGESLDTEAIQKTIDAAAESGGGRVIFPKGVYLSGAIFLKSQVDLHLGEGVVIRAVRDNSQYPEIWTRVAGIEMDWPAALINVYKQKNVRITGKGTIDGNGKYWWDKFWGDPPRSGGLWVDYNERNIRWAVDYDCKRVRPVVVYESEEVLLKDFRVDQAGFWTVSLTYSDQVHVDGLVIRNNINGYGPSSDGINTDSSKDILVENCDIDCNDDNLCIKSGRDADGLRVNRPAENIVYRNCITRSGHGLFTIGSETSGGMKNIEVYGLEAIGTNIGIRFKSAKVRGGLVENIWFHDIKMKDVKNPFHFELNWYPEYSYPQIPAEIPQEEIPERWKVMTQPVLPPERGIPEFRDIVLSNITVEKAERAFYANAYPEKQIHDLTWRNISIEAETGGSINYARDWEMENVSLFINNKQKVELNHSTHINLPEFLTEVKTEPKPTEIKQTFKDKIADLLSNNQSIPIIPINTDQETVIYEGDTTVFAENPVVYIFPHDSTYFEYFEPLGDGFYISPVTITSKKSGNSLAISSGRNHSWTFRIKKDKKPKNVMGANDWRYDSENQVLIVEKSGANFSLEIQ